MQVKNLYSIKKFNFNFYSFTNVFNIWRYYGGTHPRSCDNLFFDIFDWMFIGAVLNWDAAWAFIRSIKNRVKLVPVKWCNSINGQEKMLYFITAGNKEVQQFYSALKIKNYRHPENLNLIHRRIVVATFLINERYFYYFQ